ncbi:DUF1673 domain-containing protein [Methanococcoides burtonii]|uniref:DUF1673 family protein n=1 Tax=Methanococcoides burtonii (strain DSM 6242 / NBRC 107633 / OCM 468 / ACE-M) TaxID=259564 RepID=Q12Z87_METBU|nr:DUF1673 domain-containing protein [Methanococcoides burtonii]ABE51239.1 protein of unknown function DUF1673 [Methanococcoides burtonii DSM 6242]
MTINIAETIRKVMGWCPNLGAMEARKAMQFDNLVVNAPDKSREPNHKTMTWRNKYRNLILIGSIFGTIGPINMFISWGGKNMGIVLAGTFLGILISKITWKTTWHSLDRIAIRIPRKAATKLSIKRIVVFGIIIFIYVAVITHFMSIYGLRSVVAFLGGCGMSLLWSHYMQIVQWERKNQKTLVKSGYATPIVVVSNDRDTE